MNNRHGYPPMRILIAFLALFLAGCGVYWDHAGPEVDAYDGPRLSHEKVAIIDHASGCFHCVQLIRSIETGDVIYPKNRADRDSGLGPNKIRLRPGKYLIQIQNRKYKSSSASASGTVVLMAGRTYKVAAETCLGITCWGSKRPERVTFVWMEDTATGKVVLGEKY